MVNKAGAIKFTTIESFKFLLSWGKKNSLAEPTKFALAESLLTVCVNDLVDAANYFCCNSIGVAYIGVKYHTRKKGLPTPAKTFNRMKGGNKTVLFLQTFVEFCKINSIIKCPSILKRFNYKTLPFFRRVDFNWLKFWSASITLHSKVEALEF